MAAGDISGPETAALRMRVTEYLKAHHTMTLATVGAWPGVPEAGAVAGAGEMPAPHAASVFYAVDDKLRLVFLSKTSSLHGEHISRRASVAVTVTESYDDWEMIRGVQMWGEARLLSGPAKAGALGLYVSRFPFVRDILKHPSMAGLMRGMGVYRVEPARVAFTDNLTGVFGREVLDLRLEAAPSGGSSRHVRVGRVTKAATDASGSKNG